MSKNIFKLKDELEVNIFPTLQESYKNFFIIIQKISFIPYGLKIQINNGIYFFSINPFISGVHVEKMNITSHIEKEEALIDDIRYKIKKFISKNYRSSKDIDVILGVYGGIDDCEWLELDYGAIDVIKTVAMSIIKNRGLSTDIIETITLESFDNSDIVFITSDKQVRLRKLKKGQIRSSTF